MATLWLDYSVARGLQRADFVCACLAGRRRASGDGLPVTPPHRFVILVAALLLL
jgi:hypothetical protein